MKSHTTSLVGGDEELTRWKDVFAKDGIVYQTDDEYREAVSNLVGFLDILIEIDQKQKNTSSLTEKDNRGMYVIDKDGRRVIL